MRTLLPIASAILSTLPLTALAACGSTVPSAQRAPARAPDEVDGGWVLFENATIRLDVESAPVEALLVRGGRVVGAGAASELLASSGLAGDGVERIDLGGGVAVPGLTDAHGHLEGLGARLESVDLLGAASFDEVVERVAARAAELPAGAWIEGRGWDQTLWGTDFPEHGPLSDRVPDHPVFLERVDGHAALVNAPVLEAIGLEEGVPPIEGGRVVVDGSGRPTGVLVDNAIALVERVRPALDRSALRRRILAAQERLLALGLVCVHDMGLSPEVLSVLEELEREGALRLRVIGYLWGNDGLPAETLAAYPGERERDPRSRLRVLGVKLMLDGAMGSRGAALLEDYADAPGEHGHLLVAPERFRELARSVAAAGLQPATHAIGDRANRLLLDVYEELPGRERLRPRVEHAQLVAPDDRGRFQALGVVPSMQPTHATSDMRWAEARVGPERVRGAYAWRRLSGPRARLAFGSDFPVESPDPLAGLYAARTRCDADGEPAGGWFPEQALGAREALAAFTSGAAWAAREEGERGVLHPGSFADLTVLDRDPLAVAPAELLGARVLATVVDGELVHDARAR